MQLTPLSETINRFRQGGFVALLDRPTREGEADLLVAAEHVTGEKINFMLTNARGLLTLAIIADRLRELDIRPIEPRYYKENCPAFTEPVDYNPAVTTGVSAFERAATVRAIIDPTTEPEDFMRPGHVFPLSADPGGLAAREGHTEGAIALAGMAGLYPAVCMCELMAPDGHMAKGEELFEFSRDHDIALASTVQIVEALQAEG